MTAEEESLVASTANAYAKSKLLPRVLAANRHEHFDREIMREMGELGLLVSFFICVCIYPLVCNCHCLIAFCFMLMFLFLVLVKLMSCSFRDPLSMGTDVLVFHTTHMG